MLYALGSNGSAQLGVGHEEDLSSPQIIFSGHDTVTWKVEQFAAGGNHTVLLCDDGKVRVTGNDTDGRCGVPGRDLLSSFDILAPPHDAAGTALQVTLVAANWSVTTLVCSDGSVWMCGTGNGGELGLGAGISTVSTLQRLPSFPPAGAYVVDLASGMAHTVAVLSTGEVYGWGKGRKGQLGEPVQEQWEPRKIEGIDFTATKAVCGKDFTLVVGDSETDHLVLLGPSRNDRFGVKANAPHTLAGWKDVAASWGSIYVLNHSSGILGWGRNDHGQLPPDGLPSIEAIAAGSEHCLALTKDGKVLAWGWGEHGNCGKPTDEQGDVKARWNELGVPARATKVFAGCATSFIETAEPEAKCDR